MRYVISPLAVVFLCGVTTGHQPTMSDGSAADADNAIEFQDVQVSRVVYHEVADADSPLWITFDVDRPQTLRVQLGLPKVDRLTDYRPSLVLLGPGLPPVDAPFSLPESLGGVRFDTEELTDPEVFHEPFSGTTSWILVTEDVELPAAGRYYVVAFHPNGEAGKLWVALGVKEVFGLEDILALPQVLSEVRAFHEMPAGAGPPCFLFPAAAALVGVCLFSAHRRIARRR